jgi:D-alanine-D-alanine ligase
MQGLLEVAGIPYVGAGVLGSAIGMDKDVMKRLLRDADIPVAEFRTIRRERFDANPREACDELAMLKFPLFTKPANAGSSVGIARLLRQLSWKPLFDLHSTLTPKCLWKRRLSDAK